MPTVTVEDGTGRAADVGVLRPSGRAYLAALAVTAPPALGITLRNLSGDGTSWVVHAVSLGGTLAVAGVLVLLFLLVPCYRRLRAPDTTLLAFLDTEGRALLRLDGLHWDSAQLRALARVSGAPVTEPEGVMTRARLRASHPYAVNWAERHAVALYWASGVFFVATLVVAMVAASQGWCRPDGC